MRESWLETDGAWRTRLRGRQVFSDPRINKGTAFSDAERTSLGLVGLMPSRVMHLEEQVQRSYAQFQAQPTDFAKHVFLTALHDRNEVLFFRQLIDHFPEMLPIVYTPTVGVAIARYSHEFRRSRGIYLTVDQPDLVETSLAHSDLGPDDVDLVVATDGEAILGIGDWGVGGMEIAVGKLTVYTAAGGLDPDRVLPVVLDVGTNRESLLSDPLYLGTPHPRVPQDVYDAFIDRYVTAATKLFPNAMLHWEDFGAHNARRILARYRDRILTFNDDVQGTGAVNVAALMGAVRVTGQSLKDQRIVIYGAGTAGAGIADQLRDAMVRAGLSPAEATARIWCVDKHGLLTNDAPDLKDFQKPFARPSAEVADWPRNKALGGTDLPNLIRLVKPTVLIGTSGQHGAFTEPVVREMCKHVERPAIFPMSNPNELSEATPADIFEWSEGRALVATGSPFPPVVYEGTSHEIAQVNNALVFPGLGLGAVVARASRVTDNMLFAAALAVASTVDPAKPGATLLPLVNDLRKVSATVATAVAEAAVADGVSRAPARDLASAVKSAMWTPAYRPVLPA